VVFGRKRVATSDRMLQSCAQGCCSGGTALLSRAVLAAREPAEPVLCQVESWRLRRGVQAQAKETPPGAACSRAARSAHKLLRKGVCQPVWGAAARARRGRGRRQPAQREAGAQTAPARGAQAIELLSWPWRYEEREVLDDPDAEEARQRAREAAEAAAEAAAAAGAAPWDPNWEPGELDVRLVLLGAPDTPGLAAQPPSWARRGRATHLVLCLLLVWGCPGRAAAQLGQARLDDQIHLACRIARCLSGAAPAWFRMDSADERGADGRREFCIAGPCRPWVWHALSASPGCTPRTVDPAARGAPGRRRKVSWRTAAGRLLQAERDLNRSQREAIAKAITRTFTLWQARRPHSWHPANWGHALGGRRGQAARAQRWRQDTGSCAVSLGRQGVAPYCHTGVPVHAPHGAGSAPAPAAQRRGCACLRRGPQTERRRRTACVSARDCGAAPQAGRRRRARAPAQGPPGTGKTKTLLALLHVLATADGARRAEHAGPILACGDTNAATDNLVEGLLQRGVRVIRLGQPSKARGIAWSLSACSRIWFTLQ